MKTLERYAPLAGRIFFSLIFVMSGLGKIFDFAGTSAYMAAQGMPMVGLFLAGAIVFEFTGGLMIMTGFHARIGAALLVVFLIPATLIFHDFWTVEGPGQKIQMIMFMKNLSIFGGLLYFIGRGAGPISIDARQGRA